MAKGILIKKGADVVEKRVYTGDTSSIEQDLTNKNIPFEVYDDSDPSFVNASVKVDQSQDQIAWKALSNPNQKIDFIASKLGLL